MGNPYPTKSKPHKIGHKHTGAKSARQKSAMLKNAKITMAIKAKKFAKYKERVAAYWRGELDSHP